METEKFKDLFLFGPKSKIKAGDGLKKGRFPFYTSSPILSKWIDTEQHFDEALVLGTGGLPSIHYVNEPFSTSTDCLVAIARTDKTFNVKFVYYYIFGNIRILEQGFKGAGLKHISKPYIQNLDIPLPDLDTQDKIVAILDKAKGLIEKREQTIKMFDELLRATFLDMFGDPFKNPMKWETEELKKITTRFSDGPFGSNLKTEHYSNAGIQVIRLQNIGINKLIETDKVFVNEKHYNEVLFKYTCLPDDIIIATMGNPNLRACIIPKHIKVAVNKADCVLCRVNPEKATNYYISHLLNSEGFYFMAETYFHGQTRSRISSGQLSKIKIPIPPLNLQQKFSKIVSKIETSKEKFNQSKTQLENLLGGLSQSAFNGDLQFNTAVDLEILMENDYDFFKKHADKKAIQLLIDRMDKDLLNKKKFYEEELYNKAKMFVFNLLEDKKIEQVYEQERIKLVVK